MVLTSQTLVAFIGVSDLKRAQQFYGRTLGLSLRDESPFALVAGVGETMLRITAVARPAAAEYTVLGWRVADLPATMERLSSSGVQFIRYEGMEQDDLGIWTAPSGARVAWFCDPDGNVLSLTA